MIEKIFQPTLNQVRQITNNNGDTFLHFPYQMLGSSDLTTGLAVVTDRVYDDQPFEGTITDLALFEPEDTCMRWIIAPSQTCKTVFEGYKEVYPNYVKQRLAENDGYPVRLYFQVNGVFFLHRVVSTSVVPAVNYELAEPSPRRFTQAYVKAYSVHLIQAQEPTPIEQQLQAIQRRLDSIEQLLINK